MIMLPQEYKRAQEKYNLKPGDIFLFVRVQDQVLEVWLEHGCVQQFSVSTAASGLGEAMGSGKTPRGFHEVCDRIGEGLPLFTRFVSRVPKGICLPNHDVADAITTRLFWLDGLEDRNASSRLRYIYIHGTNREDLIGTPASEGCIRLCNADMLALWERCRGRRVLCFVAEA